MRDHGTLYRIDFVAALSTLYCSLVIVGVDDAVNCLVGVSFGALLVNKIKLIDKLLNKMQY